MTSDGQITRAAGWTRTYPLLTGIYPILHLAAANAGEWVETTDLVAPLITATVVAGLTWTMSAVVSADRDKRAFLAALGVLAFSGYGALYGVVAKLPGAFVLGPTVTTLLLIAIVSAYTTLGVVVTRRSFALISHVLGRMTMILMCFSLAQLAAQRLNSHGTDPRRGVDIPTGPPPAVRPTIYLIVLDKYTGSDELLTYYGYDNSAFDEALRNRGFVVPRHVRANYTYTRQALASLLNWEYLDSLADSMGHESTDLAPLFALVHQNRAMAFLKRLGYQIVYFPNGYEPFRSNPQADLQLPDPRRIRPEFQRVWQRTTMLSPIFTSLCVVRDCRRDPWIPQSTSQLDWEFEQLGPLAATSRPRFIVAHFLVPHEPYVYEADCSHAAEREFWPDSAAMRAAYLAQITCVNQKVLNAVDEILRRSRLPPVILIQSDHGDGHFPKEPLPLREATSDLLRARFNAFGAYLVPGAPDTLLYDGISPVNLLPRLFNFLFGTRYRKLPDRSYWVVDAKPYTLEPISMEWPTADGISRPRSPGDQSRGRNSIPSPAVGP